MAAKAIMFQGTGSDVGKSLLVTGLARLFSRRGLRVCPFKPQNMSNNAAVTIDGGEIGRAQALQARAAGVPPSVHMNPVLLKPQSETGAQVVVHGRVRHTAEAVDYPTLKRELMAAVRESFARVCADADLVLVEGAGSASEVNLRAGDIANMGFARAVDVPVILIGDIERGGVIASLVGTKVVLPPDDAQKIEGFIINKFRGDATLFHGGIEHIRAQTGWRSLGVVPFWGAAARLPAEDILGLQGIRDKSSPGVIQIAVLAYPRMSNFDDFDPLRLERTIALRFLHPGEVIPGDCQLVILPGSKATIADLDVLRMSGWDIDLKAHVRRGGHVLGICGGYQMLGRHIVDPLGIDGSVGAREGLGLLDVETQMTDEKLLREIQGALQPEGAPFSGYEMHVGRTSGRDCQRPLLTFEDGRVDGARNRSGRVAGCHIHGLFSNDLQRSAWMQRIGAGSASFSYQDDVEETLDALADHLERHLDAEALLDIAREPRIRD